ncbi:MAG TPA: NIL domain-containing protein [Phycisphaerae bacterium]|nr:NIL domain-containing protein [Phycisphaerae bacterium]
MLVKHRFELRFQRAHVQDPLTCEMTRRFKDVMFNIDSLNVGIHSATMRLSLVGKASEVKEARNYLKSLNVSLKTLSSSKYRGAFPDVPMRAFGPRDEGPILERKLWLTFLGPQKRRPFIWEISRRFDVTFKITQSTTGSEVAIMSLVLWGSRPELDGVVAFLREQDINVEFGEASLASPFGPDL